MLPRVDLIRSGDAEWLLLNNRDHISEFIRHNGFWGQAEATICSAFLASSNEGSVVIDAGANLGGFTVPIAAKLLKMRGRLYAFEPQRIVFQQLCANVFLNRLDNVFTYNVALSNESGEMSVPELDFNQSMNAGGVSLNPEFRAELQAEAQQDGGLPNTSRSDGPSLSVPCRTIDSFGVFERVAFMKVDVEGYELEVFQGAVETIKRNGFPPIIFEVWERSWYTEKAERTKQFLTDLGYTFTAFGRDVLAQHADYPLRCVQEQTEGGIRLSIEKT